MNINLKNQKGITLSKLLIIIGVIIFIVFVIAQLSGGSGNNSSSSSSQKSSSNPTITKEDRATYVTKCETIDYSSLARNPNMYKGKDFVFTGEVIQTMNESNSNETMLRVNVTPKYYQFSDKTYYEDTILVYYNYSNSAESRILEKDIVTIYGKSMGTITYESVLGSPITVPSIGAMYIDIK